MKEIIKIVGNFEMKVFQNINNKLKLIEHYKDFNLVVNVGKEKICRLLVNDNGSNWINKIGFGTSDSAVNISDTSLTDGYIKNVNSYSYEDDNTSIKFNWDLGLTENNGVTIKEYGLICEDFTLFSRKIRTGINKESNISFDGTWSIKFI